MSDSTEQVLSLRFNVPNAVTAVRIILAMVIAMLLIQADVTGIMFGRHFTHRHLDY